MHTSRGAKSALRSIAIIGATALAVSLAACAGGSGPAPQSGSATEGEIDWWGWTPDINVAETYIKEFNKEFPDIKVKYKQVVIADWEAALRPALASPSGPDVFAIQPGSRVDAFKTFAEDLNPIAEEYAGADWKDTVAPIGIDGLSADGKLTALSVGSTYAGSVWINPAKFEKYSLTPPTTLDEWISVCKTFQANGEGCFVQGASQEGFDQDTLQAIANSVEPGLWEAASLGERRWDDPNIVKTFEIWEKLFTEGIMQPGAIGYAQYPDANNDFLTGKYAMVMMGTWYMQYATTAGMTAAVSAAGVAGAEPFPIVPIPFPDVAGNGNEPNYFGDSDYGLAISTKSDNKAAAATFVTWLTLSQKGQQAVADALNDIPALLGVTPDWSKIEMPDNAVQQKPVQDIIAAASASAESRFSLLDGDIQDSFLTAAVSVADGAATPKEAMDTLQAAAESQGRTFK